MKSGVYLLKKNTQDTRVSFVGDRIPMDPDTLQSLRSRIRIDLLPYCEGRSMIPVDLLANSANCEGRIYDRNGSGIQILGIRSRDSFSGSTDMSGYNGFLLATIGFLKPACERHLTALLVGIWLRPINGKLIFIFAHVSRGCIYGHTQGHRAAVSPNHHNSIESRCARRVWS